MRNDLDFDSRTVILDRVLVIDDWSLPADRASAYARLVSDISRNATKFYARALFGRIFSVAGALSTRTLWLAAVVVWWLLMVLPSMCSGPVQHP